jgi:hypothetical protein
VFNCQLQSALVGGGETEEKKLLKPTRGTARKRDLLMDIFWKSRRCDKSLCLPGYFFSGGGGQEENNKNRLQQHSPCRCTAGRSIPRHSPPYSRIASIPILPLRSAHRRPHRFRSQRPRRLRAVLWSAGLGRPSERNAPRSGSGCAGRAARKMVTPRGFEPLSPG